MDVSEKSRSLPVNLKAQEPEKNSSERVQQWVVGLQNDIFLPTRTFQFCRQFLPMQDMVFT
jgi:hypothetical protein